MDKKDMTKEEKEIATLADEIQPQKDVYPKSEAEATTVPLPDGALGENAAQKQAQLDKDD